MLIEAKRLKVRELSAGYADGGDSGVRSMNGTLNIRPEYQREFVYKDKKRDAVIDSVMKGFPLNTMYFGVNEDSTLEVIDGQQRLISICSYIAGDFSVNYRYFHNLTEEEQGRFLDYDLINIYYCHGTEEEKLAWFHRINVQGEPLTDQELRNSVYTGKWLADAKRHFSKTKCVASNVGEGYVKGTPIRQELLELALDWVARRDSITIDEYMGRHQHDDDCKDLYDYYKKVIKWVKETFTVYRKEMKDVNWGKLYLLRDDWCAPTPAEIEDLVKAYMADDDVTNKKGIYEYLMTQSERLLSIRAFTPSQKRTAYEKQGGVCPKCGKQFAFEDMQGDHITPWSRGGHTVQENCTMLCNDCNRKKSDV